MQIETQTATKVAKRPPAPDENSWFDGEKWLPVSEMSIAHLRRAKLFAQRKAEQFWHKSGEFQEKVEMLEAEAERRGVKLKDLKSKFAKNTHIKREDPLSDPDAF